ncbi:hypothetical protein DACRYDRAFT_66169, partial [Dacryopinax primogenitus]
MGTLNEKSSNLMCRLERRVIYPNGMRPVEIHCHRSNVNWTNQNCISDLPGMPVTYAAIDTKERRETRKGRQAIDRMFDKERAPVTLTLKVNAPVILLRNMPEHVELVKGRFGTVLGFVTHTDWESRGEDISLFTDMELYPTKATVFKDLIDSSTRYPIVRFKEIAHLRAITVLVCPQDWEVMRTWGEGQTRSFGGYRRQVSQCW